MAPQTKRRVETIIFCLLGKLFTSVVISLSWLDELETDLKSTQMQRFIPLGDGRRKSGGAGCPH